MRILAAGWHGQIASAFMQIAPGRPDISAFAIGRPGLDLCEPKSVERALGDIQPDILINLAGYTDVSGAKSEPDLAFALNAEGARLLAEAAARRDVPILHLSTSHVFDGQKASAYVETDPANPTTIYGQSKLAGEEQVQSANPKHIILRTDWIYSPFGRSFVSNILQRAQLGQALTVVSDQYGNPTYALHLVEAILDIAARLTTSAAGANPWGIYHAAGRGDASWHDVAADVLAEAKAVTGLTARLEAIGSNEYATTAPRPDNTRLDCSKLKAAFGVELPPWQEGVRDCVRRLLTAELRHETRLPSPKDAS